MKKSSLLLAALFAAFAISAQAKDEPKADAKAAVEKKAEAMTKADDKKAAAADKKDAGQAKATEKKMEAADKKPEAKGKGDEKKADAAGIVDINTATEAEMSALPVIGEAIAKKIVAGRPYKGKDDLVKNKILNDKEYAKIKEKIVAKQS